MQAIERKIIRDSLKAIAALNWSPIYVDIGDGERIAVDSIDSTIKACALVDDSHIKVRNTDGSMSWVFVVLGNGKDCIPDMGIPAGEDMDGPFCRAFHNIWDAA